MEDQLDRNINLWGRNGIPASIIFADTTIQTTAALQSDWDETDNTSLAYIKNKPTSLGGTVQSDWDETDVSSLAYINNKPTSLGGGAVDTITFNNQFGDLTGSLIQGHTLKLKGLYEQVAVPGGQTNITEDFQYATGGTNVIMSGFKHTEDNL